MSLLTNWPVLCGRLGRTRRCGRGLCLSGRGTCVSRRGCQTGPNRLLPATGLATVKLDGVVQLRMMKDGVGSLPPVSCHSVIREVVEKFPTHTAWVDHGRTWNYEQYYKQVTTAAKALIELGLMPHRSVAILGTNSPEWFSCAVGGVLAGGVSTGVYTTNTATAIRYQLRHSRANVVVVEDEVQLEKVMKHRRQLPDLRAIVQYTGIPPEPWVYSWDSFLSLGECQPDGELEKRLAQQAINQPAMVAYTSGTTANPKGVLLSQDNLTWSIASAKVSYNMLEGQEEVISFLPVSHIVANVCDIWLMPSLAGTVHFPDRDALKGSLLHNLAEVRPTRFLAVPSVFERIHSKLEEIVSSAKGARSQLISWARSVSTQHHDDLLAGGKGDTEEYELAKKLVLNKIHEKFGLDRCLHGVYSGVVPLNINTINYLKSFGIIVTELYGMAEIPNHTSNAFNPFTEDASRMRLGSVGRSNAGTATRLHLVDQGVGEIAANGRNVFMGYLSDPVKTREAFDSEGWLLTGDLGTIDDDGFLTIRGRIKDTIVTSGGKTIAPGPIEERIKSELGGLVSHCLVVGDGQKHLACLLTVRAVVDPATLEMTDQLDAESWEWCHAHNCNPASVTDLVYNKTKYNAVYTAIMDKLEMVNAESPSKAAKVEKFQLLPQDFSIAGGELGPTLKVRRHAVERKYVKDIQRMFLMSHRTSLWDE